MCQEMETLIRIVDVSMVKDVGCDQRGSEEILEV